MGDEWPDRNARLIEELYDGADELMAMSQAHDREARQFPVLRRNLRLNERNRLFRWTGLLDIVSLDRAAPYLAAFGLPACDPARLAAVARDTLRAIYALLQEDQEDLVVFVEVLETCIDRLEAEAGPACAAAVLEHGSARLPYYAPETQREDDWYRLLRRLVGATGEDIPLADPRLPAAALRRVRDAVLRHIDFDLSDRLADEAEEPQDEWEEVVFARCDGWTPLDVLLGDVDYFQVQAAWREIEEVLSPDEVAALVDWGRRQAPAFLGMRADRIAAPPSPIHLRED